MLRMWECFYSKSSTNKVLLFLGLESEKYSC